MAKHTTTETRYAVARGEKILGAASGHVTVETAQSELAHIESQMRALDLEPDVRLVQFELTTTIETSRPKAYHEPDTAEAEAGEDADATAPDAGASA